jgi:hypothetical protein
MTDRPDATKIEAALRRAAYKATHGSREERSGRFLVKNERRSPSNGSHSSDRRVAKRKG